MNLHKIANHLHYGKTLKISYYDCFKDKTIEKDVEDIVEDYINYSCGYLGTFEDVSARTDTQTRVISKIVEKLYDKGLLSEDEIIDMFNLE